jgi:hypothetical protein
MPITGTLYIYNTYNQMLAAVSISLPPNQQVFRTSNVSDLVLPRNNAGYALFAHNGPPGAVLGDAFELNSSVTVMVPEKFEARYAQ